MQAEIKGLHDAGRFAQRRADASGTRADVSEARANERDLRADEAALEVAANHRRIDELELGSELDRQMMAELHADGILSQEHAAHLKQALRSSRSIGAAMGSIMAMRDVDERAAPSRSSQAPARTRTAS